LVQAVYHGTLFFVETHIVVPGSMPLTESHDIGAHLKTQLETINDVERAFVHLDFESSHMPSCKHKGN
jgi:divalent metal cation (Fe/Co/Zn/Cd) transporter